MSENLELIAFKKSEWGSFVGKNERDQARRARLFDLLDTIERNPEELFGEYISKLIKDFNSSVQITKIGSYPSIKVLQSPLCSVELVCIGNNIMISIVKRQKKMIGK